MEASFLNKFYSLKMYRLVVGIFEAACSGLRQNADPRSTAILKYYIAHRVPLKDNPQYYIAHRVPLVALLRILYCA